ncbi:hypothetical protein [Castellaniella sp.]|uniref:hypothetical protein n=1 Tax=Castellaniella sp. TaxID=1955812 RepID=UPI00355FD5BA
MGTALSAGHQPWHTLQWHRWLRKLYRKTHARSWRHNEHLWPYVKLQRNARGGLESIRVFGRHVPVLGLAQAFADAGPDMHIVLSGGSVRQIDYARLPRLQVMGVNGSIALQDTSPVEFPYYCIIDGTFVEERRELVRRVVSGERLLLLTPEVLRYILEYVPLAHIRARLCLIESLSERAHEAHATAAGLQAWQAQGRDIVLFDDSRQLGFSFDADLGWFDADTVAYAAFQAAIWGGAQRVYFHGLDITGASAQPRFYEQPGAPRPPTWLERSFPVLIEPSFRGAVQVLAQRGIRVYNLSPVSALGPDAMPFLDWREGLGPGDGARP